MSSSARGSSRPMNSIFASASIVSARSVRTPSRAIATLRLARDGEIDLAMSRPERPGSKARLAPSGNVTWTIIAPMAHSPKRAGVSEWGAYKGAAGREQCGRSAAGGAAPPVQVRCASELFQWLRRRSRARLRSGGGRPQRSYIQSYYVLYTRRAKLRCAACRGEGARLQRHALQNCRRGGRPRMFKRRPCRTRRRRAGRDQRPRRQSRAAPTSIVEVGGDVASFAIRSSFGRPATSSQPSPSR